MENQALRRLTHDVYFVRPFGFEGSDWPDDEERAEPTSILFFPRVISLVIYASVEKLLYDT
jgi:hypothetical protein